MKLAASLALCATLAACSSLPLGMLGGGGGPNVAANTQIGRENRQAAVSFERGDVANRDVQADRVETVTINNSEIPWWVILAGFWFFFLWSYLLWKLPSPDQIWRKDR